MSNADEYSNSLELLFARLPGWLQDPLRPAYNEIDGLLREVAGDPQELLKAGDLYATLAAKIEQMAQEHATDRARLISGRWDGAAYESFSTTSAGIETQLQTFAAALGNTKEVLTSAAQACTEGANAICQIVEILITFLISSFVINAVLAFFTLGATLAADVVEALAATADSLAEICQVVDRVATVLERVASILRKIADILQTVQRVLLVMLRGVDKEAGTYNDSISVIRLLYSTTNPVDAAFPAGISKLPSLLVAGGRIAARAGELAAAIDVIDHLPVGGPNVPLVITQGEHIGGSAVQTVKDAHKAEHEAAGPS